MLQKGKTKGMFVVDFEEYFTQDFKHDFFNWTKSTI